MRREGKSGQIQHTSRLAPNLNYNTPDTHPDTQTHPPLPVFNVP